MSATLRRRVVLAVILPVPLVLILGLTFLWQIRNLHERLRWVEHTQLVLSQIYLAQTLLIDQETGLRGFLYSGEPVLLEPLNRGRQLFGPAVDRLAELTSDNPNQQRNIAVLRSRYASWWVLVSPNLAPQAQPPAPRSPQAAVEVASRKTDMDGMRLVFQNMAEEERRLLAARKEQADDANHQTVLAEAIALPILGVFLAWFIHRLVVRIDAAYEEVISQRDRSLENERRARAAAEALSAEISERSAEMERMFRAVREERDTVRARLSRFEKAGG